MALAPDTKMDIVGVYSWRYDVRHAIVQMVVKQSKAVFPNRTRARKGFSSNGRAQRGSNSTTNAIYTRPRPHGSAPKHP